MSEICQSPLSNKTSNPVPLSLRDDLPNLNQRSFIYVGAHAISISGGAKDSRARDLCPNDLDELLSRATESGFSVSLLDENPRKLILTFDDGRIFPDSLASVLSRHKATAIFFVCTARSINSYPDSPTYWELDDENRRYVYQNHIVGSHTHKHILLSALSARDQRHVLQESVAQFRDWFQFSPWCFAYPWGRYNRATLRILAELNIRCAFLASPSFLPSHRFTIPRVFIDRPEWKSGDINYIFRSRRNLRRSIASLVRSLHAYGAVNGGYSLRQ